MAEMTQELQILTDRDGIVSFSEPVQWLVQHPGKGQLLFTAYSSIDAKLQAAWEWELGLEELPRMRLGLENSVVALLKRHREMAAGVAPALRAQEENSGSIPGAASRDCL